MYSQQSQKTVTGISPRAIQILKQISMFQPNNESISGSMGLTVYKV